MCISYFTNSYLYTCLAFIVIYDYYISSFLSLVWFLGVVDVLQNFVRFDVPY
jgi:hypothetical protein